MKDKKAINFPKSIENFLLHLHPIKIDARAVKFTRTFGLGGITALLFIILCVTGMVLRFSYVPSVAGAYDSILALERETIFGHFLRNLHHWSAKLMIIVSFLHMVRVIYSMAIFKKRAENWIYGLVMMFFVVAASFTGYLLPWDQLAFWAVTVVTQIIEYIPFIGVPLADMVRGSSTVDEQTLLNFYTLHTGILPLLFIVLMSMHFWLIRKAGGVALPKIEKPEKVNVNPNLIWIEIMAAAIVIAALFLTSAFYHAPLLEEANPLVSPNPSKAPWYFLGAQELLLHLHPVFGAVLVPLAVTAFFVYLPFFRVKNLNVGVWFNSPLGKQITIQSSIVSFVFTFVLIYLLDHFLHFQLWFTSWPMWISNGILPFLAYMLPMGAYVYFWKAKKQAENTEILLACTSILLSSYLSMLFISLLLRGEGMTLIF
ncbi:cytochrome b N-terminal domain-containing protein [Saccharicrinis aurantiacus]|uniref:cytochrome b N-terminal domain-containing protein n=1 Tax=Saccharicrinis aurantiacus TaxID=1849719 RepID=UPI00094FE375|nr:cytochrome b N-terminal domain-containing protein [Saccharicrinis aurantiacus]